MANFKIMFCLTISKQTKMFHKFSFLAHSTREATFHISKIAFYIGRQNAFRLYLTRPSQKMGTRLSLVDNNNYSQKTFSTFRKVSDRFSSVEPINS